MSRRVHWWFETDAYSKWGRKYLVWVNRPGARKKVKTLTHRRERNEAKAEIASQVADLSEPQ